MATTAQPRAGVTLGKVAGGVAGGLVFGAMMGAMGMLPLVASVVGSQSAFVGFLYHMFNSVVIGALFGLVFGAPSYSYARGALWGLIYGAIWWVLGPMILMPGTAVRCGSDPADVDESLVGHLIYGLIYVAYSQRQALGSA